MTRNKQEEVEENEEGQGVEEGENFCELCNEIRGLNVTHQTGLNVTNVKPGFVGSVTRSQRG